MGSCGDCKNWDTTGYNLRPKAKIGECRIVARNCCLTNPDKMISIKGLEHAKPMASGVIQVLTMREFGCKQWQKEGR